MCSGFQSRLAAVQTCRKLHLLQDIFPAGFNPSQPPAAPGTQRGRETLPVPAPLASPINTERSEQNVQVGTLAGGEMCVLGSAPSPREPLVQPQPRSREGKPLRLETRRCIPPPPPPQINVPLLFFNKARPDRMLTPVMIAQPAEGISSKSPFK